MVRSYDTSARRLARARKVLAGGVSSSFRAQVTPVLSFERGAGPYLYDADGHELLDYTLAWGLLIAGSCHPRINAAVRDQLERSYAVGAGHELEVRLAERLTEVMLPGVDLVTFASSGSEIVQVALSPGAGGHRARQDPQVRGPLPRLDEQRAGVPPPPSG